MQRLKQRDTFFIETDGDRYLAVNFKYIHVSAAA